MPLMSLDNVVACRLLCKPRMRANETFDSIDSTELATGTGGNWFAHWFSKPAPTAQQSSQLKPLSKDVIKPFGQPVKPKHKHVPSDSSGEGLRPLGWGEGMYGWSQ